MTNKTEHYLGIVILSCLDPTYKGASSYIDVLLDVSNLTRIVVLFWWGGKLHRSRPDEATS